MSRNTRGIDRIKNGLPGAIEEGIDRGANLIADLARQLAPERSGDLKGTIRVEDGAQPLARKVIAGGINGVDYAAFQEYGTSIMEAQPYMTPAKEQINVQAEVNAAVRRLVQG